MTRPLNVGDVIHGFAYGACARIEAIGPDWIVARPNPNDPDTRHHGPSFTSGRSNLELCIQDRDKPCPNCILTTEPQLTAYEGPR